MALAWFGVAWAGLGWLEWLGVDWDSLGWLEVVRGGLGGLGLFGVVLCGLGRIGVDWNGWGGLGWSYDETEVCNIRQNRLRQEQISQSIPGT